ncbi:MAG: tRNA (guanosine(37)-N1)-methyltransferase TrmD [Planctomycetota bacterium]
MRIDVFTIFPELFHPFLTMGIVERARFAGALEVRLTQLRAFTEDRHRSVDDRPYGGGPGMLFKPEPVFRALHAVLGVTPSTEAAAPSEATSKTRLIVLCPSGEQLSQPLLEELAGEEHLALLCGRYEGYDQRILDAFPWQRVSIGDYVLSGGEIPAMALVEGVARLIPGVLGHDESAVRDSFSEWPGASGLDHPHYTRPPQYRGMAVPDILLSGDHGRIEEWRRKESERATRRREASREVCEGPEQGA